MSVKLMKFLQAFPIAIIDEDFEGKRSAGRGSLRRRSRSKDFA